MATKSMDLGQVMGTSAYQEAQAGGYTGTKEEFQEALANVGNGGETFVIQAELTESNEISNVDRTLDELNAARQAGKAIRLKLTSSSGVVEAPLMGFAYVDSIYMYVFSTASADAATTIQFTYEDGSLTTLVNSTDLLKLSNDAPSAPGTASAGTSDSAARADHVHPKEVSATDRATWNGKASKPKTVSVTLTAAGWGTDKKQTVTVPGVLADTTAQVIWVAFASETALDAYMDAGIVPVAQGANSVTFRADTIPTAAISVNVVIQEVGA